ncbi:MAG TPA: hypothetical protein VE464_14165 [Streptosporangiaceae bacterium]|nr:hypothetical protein [Streptosporangiaceae bacterium]
MRLTPGRASVRAAMAAAETVTGIRTKFAGPSARTLSRVPAANRSLTAPPPRSPAQARASTPSRAWPGTCSRTNGSALAAYLFEARHVAVIVSQVPTGLIGKG